MLDAIAAIDRESTTIIIPVLGAVNEDQTIRVEVDEDSVRCHCNWYGVCLSQATVIRTAGGLKPQTLPHIKLQNWQKE